VSKYNPLGNSSTCGGRYRHIGSASGILTSINDPEQEFIFDVKSPFEHSRSSGERSIVVHDLTNIISLGSATNCGKRHWLLRNGHRAVLFYLNPWFRCTSVATSDDDVRLDKRSLTQPVSEFMCRISIPNIREICQEPYSS
jgi:hypothetical protein